MKNRKIFTGILINFMIVIMGLYIQIENVVLNNEDVNIFSNNFMYCFDIK